MYQCVLISQGVCTNLYTPGRLAQSVAHQTVNQGIASSIPGQAAYLCEDWLWPFSPTSVSSRTVVSYWHKYVHLVLVTCLERLSMPRNSVSRLTDRRYMTEKLLNTA